MGRDKAGHYHSRGAEEESGEGAAGRRWQPTPAHLLLITISSLPLSAPLAPHFPFLFSLLCHFLSLVLRGKTSAGRETKDTKLHSRAGD